MLALSGSSPLVCCAAGRVGSGAARRRRRVLPGFHSPSGNIRCYYQASAGPAILRCQIGRADYAKRLTGYCGSPPIGVDWGGFELTATRKGAVTCTGGVLYEPGTERPRPRRPPVRQDLPARRLHVRLADARRHLPQPVRPRPLRRARALARLVTRKQKAARVRTAWMRWRGLEPPRPKGTRPSTLRVYQFRHQRVEARQCSRAPQLRDRLRARARASRARPRATAAARAPRPSDSRGSSTRNPGPSVAISSRIPSGMRK